MAASSSSSSSSSAALPVTRLRVPGATGGSVEIVTDPSGEMFAYQVGNSLWGAALELVRHLCGEDEASDDSHDDQRSDSGGGDAMRAPRFDRIRVLELGAGVGAVGIALASVGADVTLTDLPEMLPLLRMNIARNGLEAAARAQPLDWRDKAVSVARGQRPSFDLIVGAEVSYDADLHDNLLDTIEANSDLGRTEVVLAIPLRDEDADLVRKARTRGFVVLSEKKIPPSPDHESTIEIFRMRLDGPGTCAFVLPRGQKRHRSEAGECDMERVAEREESSTGTNLNAKES